MPPFDRHHDARVRAATFEWLSDQVARHGDVLPWKVLSREFELDGERVPLVGPPGIFKPKILEVPISIRTTPESQYSDGFTSDGFLSYSYRGTDPDHRDNTGLRFAMREQIPLVYFYKVVKAKYVAAWPVFIVGDDRDALKFTVAVDDADYLGLDPETLTGKVKESGDEVRRRYITSRTRVRLHQRAFRERVLEAYRRECAFCRFRHDELLDAAHIIPDSDPEGEPVVSNGMSLCRLHHAAFDRHFVGVTPDYELKVRPDILEEEDGPTLVHGLQALEGARLVLPRSTTDRPNRDLLGRRWREFQEEVERAV